MPFSDPMTWVARENRWVKRITKPVKRSFYFVPRKHDVEATEAGSRAAMRAWWAGQEAILYSQSSQVSKELARHFLTAFLKLRPIGSELPIDEMNDFGIEKHFTTHPKPRVRRWLMVVLVVVCCCFLALPIFFGVVGLIRQERNLAAIKEEQQRDWEKNQQDQWEMKRWEWEKNGRVPPK